MTRNGECSSVIFTISSYLFALQITQAFHDIKVWKLHDLLCTPTHRSIHIHSFSSFRVTCARFFRSIYIGILKRDGAIEKNTQLLRHRTKRNPTNVKSFTARYSPPLYSEWRTGNSACIERTPQHASINLQFYLIQSELSYYWSNKLRYIHSIMLFSILRFSAFPHRCASAFPVRHF